MARTKSQPGLEVYILVDGKLAKEYKTTPTDNDLAVNIIQAEADKEFVIMTRVQPPYEIVHDAITFKVEIDGSRVLGATFRKKKYEAKGLFLEQAVIGVTEGTDDGPVIRPFKFVEMLRGNGNSTPKKFCKGEIIVRVFEAKSEGPADQIPEQALVKTNGTSHGDPKPAKQQVVWKLKNVNNLPIATYVFKYQSSCPKPIATPSRKNYLYSIPMYSPESANADTVPTTPTPSSKKRALDLEGDDQTATPSKAPKSRKYVQSIPIRTKIYQAPTVESEGEEEREENPKAVPTRAPAQAMKQHTPRRTPSSQKPAGKHQAHVEDEDDSSATLRASSPSPRRPGPATSTNKATPKKPRPTPKNAPSTPGTPSKLLGLKLTPLNSPAVKDVAEVVDLTMDSD